jgi:hypothetical protein
MGHLSPIRGGGGNLSFLLLILFSSTGSLGSLTDGCDHDWAWDGLEKVLNEFQPGGKPCWNISANTS